MSALTVSKTVSVTSCCQRSEMVSGKLRYSSWSLSSSWAGWDAGVRGCRTPHAPKLGPCAQYLDAFGVLLVKGADVEGVGRVHLAAGWDEGRWVLWAAMGVRGVTAHTRVLVPVPSHRHTPLTFCRNTICQSRPLKKGSSFTSCALWREEGGKRGRRGAVPAHLALSPGGFGDTDPRPMQPRRRLTSRCSSPSSRERSSGEKESGSSTACGRFREHTGEWGQGHTDTQMGTNMCSMPLGAHSPLSVPTHHGEGHPVNLVLVLGLVLPERAVPGARRERGLSSAQLCPAVPS